MQAVKQALIIAAGNGSRLQPASGNIPKPLTPVCGIPLINRLLHQAHKAGIESCVIVLGYQGESLRRALVDDADLPPIKIEWVTNDDWKQPNGLSVLKAKDLLRDDFVLLMADHLFQSVTLARFLRRRPSPNEVILAVDRKIDQIYDIDDATKVKLNGTQILAIGKELKDFNAVDTGMFLCSPSIFAALENAKAKGNCSLSDGMKELISAGKLRFFDVKDAWWLDVDTPAALRQAERNLFEQLREKDEGWIECHINRPLVERLTQRLLRTSVSTQFLKGVMLGAGIFGAFLLAHARFASVLLGVFIFQALMILNLATEGLGKLKLEESAQSENNGLWTQRMIYVVFLLGVIFGFYRWSGDTYALPIGALTLIDAVLAMSFAEKRYGWLRQSEATENAHALRDEEIAVPREIKGFSGPWGTLFSLSKVFLRPQSLIFIALLLALLGKLNLIFWFIFLGTHVAALTLFYGQSRPLADSETKLAP